VILLIYWDNNTLPGWGRQIGRILLENFTDLRNFNKATSWLYEFMSKFLWRITTLTALMIGTPSVFTYWSWSPSITRIFDRFSLQGRNRFSGWMQARKRELWKINVRRELETHITRLKWDFIPSYTVRGGNHIIVVEQTSTAVKTAVVDQSGDPRILVW